MGTKSIILSGNAPQTENLPLWYPQGEEWVFNWFAAGRERYYRTFSGAAVIALQPEGGEKPSLQHLLQAGGQVGGHGLIAGLAQQSKHVLLIILHARL